MDLYLATGNQNKKREIQNVLPDYRIIIPRDLGIEFDPDECGSTFLENAMIKARALFDITGKPVISDDSGLIVDALAGEPGIFSARYGNKESGKKLTASERNAYLLSRLSGKKQREARFVCNMVFLIDEYRFVSVQEDFCGLITGSISGSNGFGYDPVFFLPELGMTAAELDDEQKNRISHRGKALRGISEYIIRYYAGNRS